MYTPINIKDEVVNYYLEKPISFIDCGKKFKMCHQTASVIVNSYGVPSDYYTKSQINNPDLDEHYFSNIDTEAKAYYLGLILSDGNVFDLKRKNGEMLVNITQYYKDSYILTRFLNEVHSNRSLSYDGRGCCQACVVSKIMADDLAMYGIVPNKTFKEQLPIIDEELQHHLIRGILDGDGCIHAHILPSHVTGNDTFPHYISFCGSKLLMHQLSNYLSHKLDINRPKVYEYKNGLNECKWKNRIAMVSLGCYLYADATIFLSRKYEKFVSFLKHYNLLNE